jgi:hypothetical protein
MTLFSSKNPGLSFQLTRWQELFAYWRGEHVGCRARRYMRENDDRGFMVVRGVLGVVIGG